MAFRSQRGLSRASVSSRPKRQTKWAFGPGGTAVNSFSASSSGLLGSGIGLTVATMPTIVRIRGVVELLLDSGVSGDGYAGALGIGLVTGDAFAVGITAVPTPLDDEDWDGWMWHKFFSLHNPTATAGQEGALRFEIDTRAMRKFGEGMIVIAVAEVVETGVSVLEISLNSRMLFKLP